MLNKVILMGRLTRDPEARSTSTGVSMCNFSLAVQRDFARQGEEKQTDFVNITAFRSTADFVLRYFRKGMLVAICGKLQQRTWQDAEGKQRSTMDVVADEVHFAESKRDNQGDTMGGYNAGVPAHSAAPQNDFAQTSTAAPSVGFIPDVSDDDLPF